MKDNWRKAKFGDVAQVVTGSTPSTQKPEYFGGNIPFVTPVELDNNSPIMTSKTTLTELGAEQVRVLPSETVLVCCIGSLGKIGIAGTRLVTNQQINSLIFDKTKVLPRYGYHYCRTLKHYLEQIAPSTTLPIINKSRFSALEIPLPPLPEQKRIAEILDKADALREKRRLALQKLDMLLQSVFLDMFGDPVKNPKGWDVVPVSSFVSNFQGGKSLLPESSENIECKFRVLKVSAVTELTYKPEQSKPVPLEYMPPQEHFVHPGDLLFSRANTSELVGAVSYVWQTPDNLLLPDKLWRFVWKEKDAVNPLFIVPAR